MEREAVLTALDGALKAARQAGASDAEASFEGQVAGITRFANSTLTQTGQIVERTIRVRVLFDGRLGTATTSAMTSTGLAEATRTAVALARTSPRSLELEAFAAPDPQGPIPMASTGFSESTAAFSPGDRAGALARVFTQAARQGLSLAGTFVTSPRAVAVATAKGISAHHPFTDARLSVIATPEGTGGRGASGYASYYGKDVRGCDVEALAETAIRTAVAAKNATTISPGTFDVVLLPAAVAEVLEWLAITSLGARSVQDGTSLLAGRQGQRVCGEEIHLCEDPRYAHPQLVPLPFDAEGVARQRVTFLEAGIAGRPVTDAATAAQLGGKSTGHAAPLGEDLTEGPAPVHVVLGPGNATVDELLAKVDRGLLVTRFHYVNGLLDPRRATMTGMTRDGTFLIENGRVGQAVTNLRWTESLLGAFSRVGGVGRDLAAAPATWTRLGTFLCPALLLRDFHFTGGSPR
jgi:predicted Zn-dependent protease